MKILRWLGIAILVMGALLSYLPRASAESSAITATIFIRVLEKPKEKLAQSPDLQECLDSQLQKNPQSVPEIKVERIAQNTPSEEPQIIRYTICEKL
jgi:hypothetical protein